MEPNRQVIEDYLRALRPGGPWVISFKPPSGCFPTKTYSDMTRLLDAVALENSERGHVYYYANVMAHPVSKKPSETDVAFADHIVLDIDAPKTGDVAAGLAKIRDAIDGWDGPPIAGVVFTGHGYQLLHRVERVDLSSPGALADVKARAKAYTEGWRALGLNVDSVFDVCRALRLPGTVNWKKAGNREPAVATVYRPLAGAPLPLSTFPLPAVPPPVVGGDVDSFDSLPDDVRQLALAGEEDGKYRRPDGTTDESSALFAFIGRAHDAGASDDLILHVTSSDTYGISRHNFKDGPAEAEKNARRQIDKWRIKPRAARPAAPPLKWRFESFSELRARRPELPPTLVWGVLGRGDLGVLFGEPGIGKSWAGEDLAFSLAAAQPWLGSIPTTTAPCRVGAILLEMPDGHVWDRGEKICAQRGFDVETCDRVFVTTPQMLGTGAINLEDPSHLEPLIERAKELKFDVVIVDALIRAHVRNEDKATEMAPVMKACDRLRHETGALVILVHHSRKTDEDGGVNDLRGSGVLISFPHAHFKFVRAPGELVKIYIAKSNFGAKAEPVYARISKDGPLEVTDKPETTREIKRSRREQIVHILDGAPGATTAGIDAALRAGIDDEGKPLYEYTYKTLQRDLSDLVRTHRIVRGAARGSYILPF